MNKQVTWKQVARHISLVTGKPISVTRCQQIAERSLQKIVAALAEDRKIQSLHRDGA
jgi:hypothetical protein